MANVSCVVIRHVKKHPTYRLDKFFMAILSRFMWIESTQFSDPEIQECRRQSLILNICKSPPNVFLIRGWVKVGAALAAARWGKRRRGGIYKKVCGI